ncbi:hypothetical protein RR46_08154 [Papilio xuthus]|uniref:Uncharacterized protein n=1 Tax=Papilio xuthus TaxID=66420 RepID=A0A194QA56_PAPXU|nr:hypothetical protein RR46_08154 [Papilio xuthus]
MPKYYRFRPTSPTRRIKRNKEKDKDTEFFRNETDFERNWLDLTLACPATPSWYLRRIAWRESHPPLMGLPRQLATGLRAELQINNRPILVFKMPPTLRTQDMLQRNALCILRSLEGTRLLCGIRLHSGGIPTKPLCSSNASGRGHGHAFALIPGSQHTRPGCNTPD